MPDRIVVAITGASGVIYGIRLLQVLREMPQIESHLVMSAAAKQTIAAETDWSVKDVEALAATVHDVRQIGASIASGSLTTRAMIVIPCSIKTLSAIANSYADDLIARSADVTLKEGRLLVLVVRETPLHLGHLRLMERAAEAGAVIFPPLPAFYGRPRTIEQIVDGTVGGVLARVGLDNDRFAHWTGMHDAIQASSPTIAPGAFSAAASPREDLAGFLNAQTTLSLATTNADGSPHACDVFYAADSRANLYFVSDPGARHIQNLLHEPRVAVTVHGASQGWQEIRGAQIIGDASPVAGTVERIAGLSLYAAKFPFVTKWLPSIDALGRAIEKIGTVELYQVAPRWTRWIDNTRGFGHKDEWPA
jgi:4-hydroxy-3-polyprenylbenzoate decarboxylase